MDSTPQPTIHSNGHQGRKEILLANVNKTLNCVSIASVLAIHFLLGVAILLIDGFYDDEKKSYFALYNSIFYLTLFWSVQEHLKPGPLHMAIVVNLISIVLDIIVASFSWGSAFWFVIINIIFRPITSIVLLRKSYQRKRRFNLNGIASTSLLEGILNLLYQSNISDESSDQAARVPVPTVLSSLATNKLQNPIPTNQLNA